MSQYNKYACNIYDERTCDEGQSVLRGHIFLEEEVIFPNRFHCILVIKQIVNSVYRQYQFLIIAMQ